MSRPVEIASGIGVFLTSLLSLMAVLKLIFDWRQSVQKVPLISIISLSLTGLAVSLSFVGAFILLSWARKPK
jgi:ABC-type long-subunit fatty acid transport system fused permease/ATPase subunit